MGRVDGEAAMQGHVLISPFPDLTFLIPPFLSHGRPSHADSDDEHVLNSLW